MHCWSKKKVLQNSKNKQGSMHCQSHLLSVRSGYFIANAEYSKPIYKNTKQLSNFSNNIRVWYNRSLAGNMFLSKFTFSSHYYLSTWLINQIQTSISSNDNDAQHGWKLKPASQATIFYMEIYLATQASLWSRLMLTA